ncbi:MAG: hypothetical protein ACTHU0_08425, partial [Kofleriaceae bacterium]
MASSGKGSETGGARRAEEAIEPPPSSEREPLPGATAPLAEGTSPSSEPFDAQSEKLGERASSARLGTQAEARVAAATLGPPERRTAPRPRLGTQADATGSMQRVAARPEPPAAQRVSPRTAPLPAVQIPEARPGPRDPVQRARPASVARTTRLPSVPRAEPRTPEPPGELPANPLADMSEASLEGLVDWLLDEHLEPEDDLPSAETAPRDATRREHVPVRRAPTLLG